MPDERRREDGGTAEAGFCYGSHWMSLMLRFLTEIGGGGNNFVG
jgi:hypothetical protein